MEKLPSTLLEQALFSFGVVAVKKKTKTKKKKNKKTRVLQLTEEEAGKEWGLVGRGGHGAQDLICSL